MFVLIVCSHWLVLLFFLPVEIEKLQKDEEKEEKEEEKFIDVVINKNMKLGQKVLIPFKQFPKVSTAGFGYIFSDRTVQLQTKNGFYSVSLCDVFSSPNIYFTLL